MRYKGRILNFVEPDETNSACSIINLTSFDHHRSRCQVNLVKANFAGRNSELREETIALRFIKAFIDNELGRKHEFEKTPVNKGVVRPNIQLERIRQVHNTCANIEVKSHISERIRFSHAAQCRRGTCADCITVTVETRNFEAGEGLGANGVVKAPRKVKCSGRRRTNPRVESICPADRA